jgi:hypothetical protein
MFDAHTNIHREPTLFREPQVNNLFYLIYIILFVLLVVLKGTPIRIFDTFLITMQIPDLLYHLSVTHNPSLTSVGTKFKLTLCHFVAEC